MDFALADACSVNYYYQLCSSTRITEAGNNFNLHVGIGILEQTGNPIECIEYLSKFGKIKCNYSILENMELAMKNRINANEMIGIIRSKEFIQNSFGDIYIIFE